MELARDFSAFEAVECGPTWSDDRRSCVIDFAADVEAMIAVASDRLADAAEWKACRFLWFDAMNKGPHSIALTLSFWDADNATDTPDLVSTIGLLPFLSTRVTFPLSALDSQRMFLSRTPGKLKTVIHGNKVRSLARLAVGKKKCSDPQRLEIRNLHLSSEEPAYPLEERALIDELGQWSGNEWPGKTRDASAMARSMKGMLAVAGEGAFFPEWTATGSWKERRFAATGFFRTQHDGKRWWLVDPEGYAFYSVGVDCVRPGEGCNTRGILKLCGPLPPRDGAFAACWSTAAHMGLAEADLLNHSVANLIQVFGAEWEDAWRRIARANLVRWGLNTVGNWSDPGFARWSGLPYVFPMEGFPTTDRRIFRDFPDVYSPEYERNAEAFARQMAPFRGDRNLIGYFLRNEPEWAFIKDLVIAEELLETSTESRSREALIRFLAERYHGSVEALNDAWHIRLASLDGLRAPLLKAARRSSAAAADLRAFSRAMVDRYVRIPSDAVRRVDPNHLNLGMRYGYVSSDEVLAGCDSFDVYSINCYDDDPGEAIEKAGRMTNLPVMIGEFHFGALDRGLSATGIRGAAGQEERGRAYRHYAEQAAANPFCVGVHYFQYNEQPTLGRFDGENYDIGLVDVCQTPLREFVEGIVECHRNTYRVAAGEVPPTPVRGKLIHPIFF
jgi:hypothetical protein